jgi:hypothetical protein
MGLFSDLVNKGQLVMLQGILQEKVASLGQEIGKRKLQEELGVCLTEVMKVATDGLRRADLKGQLSVAESVLAQAGSLERTDIVNATSLYLVATLVAASARRRLYPKWGGDFQIIEGLAFDTMNRLAAFRYDWDTFLHFQSTLDLGFC